MDFGTFYRMRQLRGSARDMTSDDVDQSENFYNDFDHPVHPQFNRSMGFEDDEINFYRNNTIGRDFNDNQPWEFPEERDFRGIRDTRGRDRAMVREREIGPFGMRGRGFGPRRGWPSDRGRGQDFNENLWTDHGNDTGPGHHDGDCEWDEESREHVNVKQRDSQNRSSDQDKLQHMDDPRKPVTSSEPRPPEDNGNERSLSKRLVSSDISANDLPGARSDAPVKAEENQTLKDQKPYIKEEKMDDHDGKKKSLGETTHQKSKSTSDGSVSEKRVDGKIEDKAWEKGITADIEDMAVTQLQDPNRTVFSCCYCGIANYDIDAFKDHVKGNFHKENFASLIEGKRRKQQHNLFMEFKREELGSCSFLEMDLAGFTKEPVIGLSYVTEFQSIYGIKCICHLCGVMFSHFSGQNHVTNLQHRMRYLKKKRPNRYANIRVNPYRQSRMNLMYRSLEEAEHHDGRGTPAIYVFEDKKSNEGNSSGSANEQDVANFRQAFGDFVNGELQTARQKITDDPQVLDEELEESDSFLDRSEYVQLWDLEGDRGRFFNENFTFETDFSSDLGSEYQEERGHLVGADTMTDQEQRYHGTKGERGMGFSREGALVSGCGDAAAGGGGTSADSPKLRAKDVSGPSSDAMALGSVNKGQKDKTAPAAENTKKEKKIEEKKNNQEGGDGNKMQKQGTDDTTKREGCGDAAAGGGGTSADSPKLRAKDVSGPGSDAMALGSVNKGQKDKTEPAAENTKKEKKIEEKKNDQEGGDGNKMQQQGTDDTTKREGRFKDITRFMSRSELGKFSYLKKEMEANSKDPIIGLSYVKEYQHTTGVHGICSLCCVSFSLRCCQTHLLSYKHRLRYLRERNPKIYVEIAKLTSRRKVMVKMLSFLKTIAKIDGTGTPEIHVYDIKEDSHNGALNSDFDSDSLAKDPLDLSQDEIDRQHSAFCFFVRQETLLRKQNEREPVVFEFNSKQDYLLQESASKRSHCPDPPPETRHALPPPRFGEHPYYMRMRADPYFNPDPYEASRRARLYPDDGFPPDHMNQGRGDEPYLDPDPLKRMRRDERCRNMDPIYRMRRDEPYLNPDPLKRDRPHEPYLDPDPLKRIRRDESHYDPHSLKRRVQRDPYLDPDPLKRIRFDEPYIHPDPLKRVLPSQKAANKPVVIDYGHGSNKKSVKNTADQWEQDIKDILNESKGPDSLAQLSCSYSSPKKEDTPPPPQPKRPLPFSRSYMEKSKELQKKSSSSSKRGDQYSPDRGESRGRYKSRSPSRKYRRSRSPLSVKDRSRAKLKDPLRRDRTDFSSRIHRRSRSPDNFRSKAAYKDKDQTIMKRRSSRSPVREKIISSSRADRSISPPRKRSFDSRDLHTREYKKSRSPVEVDLRSTLKDRKRAYDKIQPNSSNLEEDKVDPPLKFTSQEQMNLKQPAKSSSWQKGSLQQDVIDLTSDEEISLSSRRDVLPTHPNVNKSSPKKEPEPTTGDDIDEAQADLIAEMLLTMKNSIIGQDADPQSALKAILSQDITKVLLATKQMEKKESPPPIVRRSGQDNKNRDSLERQNEEKAGTSEEHFDLKSKVKRTPPPREKIAFSFAGRSRASGNLVSQSVLHLSEDENEDDNN